MTKGHEVAQRPGGAPDWRRFAAGWIAAFSFAISGCSTGGLSADVHQGFAPPPPPNDPGERAGRSSGPPHDLLTVSAIVARPPGRPPVRVRMDVPAGWTLRKVRAKNADAYVWMDSQSPFDRVALVSDGRVQPMKNPSGKWDVQSALSGRGIHWTSVRPDGLRGRFSDRSPQVPAARGFLSGPSAGPAPPESQTGEGIAAILPGQAPLLVVVEVFAPPYITNRVLAGVRFPAAERTSGKG